MGFIVALDQVSCVVVEWGMFEYDQRCATVNLQMLIHALTVESGQGFGIALYVLPILVAKSPKPSC